MLCSKTFLAALLSSPLLGSACEPPGSSETIELTLEAYLVPCQGAHTGELCFASAEGYDGLRMWTFIVLTRSSAMSSTRTWRKRQSPMARCKLQSRLAYASVPGPPNREEPTLVLEEMVYRCPGSRYRCVEYYPQRQCASDSLEAASCDQGSILWTCPEDTQDSQPGEVLCQAP